MRALQLEEPGRISIVERPWPAAPGAGEVLVRVRMVGYCGSDLTSFRGANPLISYPRLLGHEIAGTVEALGDGVDGLAPGQAVTILPYFNCGSCHACRMGRLNACRNNQTMGVQREGAMTGAVVVPATKVVAAEGLRLRDLALVEPLAVGFHAVRRADIQADETVVILGSGVIGLGALLGARARGARTIAVDLSAEKLDVARRLGADEVVDASREDVADRVRASTGGEGSDVVIEAVGSAVTFLQAVDIAASCARVVYVGYAKHPVAYDTKQFLLKELDIRGSRGSQLQDFDAVVAWLRQEPDTSQTIVSRIVPLDEAPDAMAAWDREPGAFTKIMVRLDGEDEA